MRHIKRAPMSRVMAALAGALAILALVAGPSLAHPRSRTYEPNLNWATTRTGLTAALATWTAGVEAAIPELEAGGDGPDESEAPETEAPETDAPETEAPETDAPEATDPEGAGEDNDDQGENEDANGDSSGQTDGSHDGGSDQGDGSGDHNGGGEEGGD